MRGLMRGGRRGGSGGMMRALSLGWARTSKLSTRSVWATIGRRGLVGGNDVMDLTIAMMWLAGCSWIGVEFHLFGCGEVYYTLISTNCTIHIYFVVKTYSVVSRRCGTILAQLRKQRELAPPKTHVGFQSSVSRTTSSSNHDGPSAPQQGIDLYCTPIHVLHTGSISPASIVQEARFE